MNQTSRLIGTRLSAIIKIIGNYKLNGPQKCHGPENKGRTAHVAVPNRQEQNIKWAKLLGSVHLDV